MPLIGLGEALFAGEGEHSECAERLLYGTNKTSTAAGVDKSQGSIL